jgi:GDP-4-dehydro-6-deoxy-D-mannose reductase
MVEKWRRYLLIGGNGLLGNSFSKFLSENEIRFVISARSRDTAREGQPVIDVREADSVFDHLEKFEYSNLINFSGLTMGATRDLFDTNVLGPQNILEGVKKYQPYARVTMIGSAAEYGEAKELPISESHPLEPQSTYGLSKVLQAQIVAFYARSGLTVNIGRVFNVVDKSASTSSLVGKLFKGIDEIQSGYATKIKFGPLGGIRDFLDTRSISELIFLVNSRGAAGEDYNIGSGKPLSCRNLVEKILKAHELTPEVIDERQANSTEAPQISSSYADMKKTLSLTQNSSYSIERE